MIYTSYYGNFRNFSQNATVYGISLKKIKGYKSLPIFAPTFLLVKNKKNGEITEKGFTKLYLMGLKMQNLKGIIKKIKNEAIEKDVILCCYEKPEDFCHRHILSKYLNDNFNCQIKEF